MHKITIRTANNTISQNWAGSVYHISIQVTPRFNTKRLRRRLRRRIYRNPTMETGVAQSYSLSSYSLGHNTFPSVLCIQNSQSAFFYTVLLLALTFTFSYQSFFYLWFLISYSFRLHQRFQSHFFQQVVKIRGIVKHLSIYCTLSKYLRWLYWGETFFVTISPI